MSAGRTIRLLKAARKLLARKGGWTKGAFARDKSGAAVPISSKRAVCFCAYGALERAGPNAHDARMQSRVMLLQEASRQSRSLSDYNDRPKRTQQQVLALFDRAIARLEKRP